MTRDGILANLRDLIDDATAVYRWTDQRLLGYLAEGQDKFCEDTGFFIDKTNYSITLVSGTASYAIPDRIIEVLDIYDGTRRLGTFQDSDRPNVSPDWSVVTSPVLIGSPSSWQADNETGSITFDTTPTSAEEGTVLTLRVWRYSQYALDDDDIDGEGTTATPEIPSRFHPAIIEWAAFKAYTHHDMEEAQKIKAQDHLNRYYQYVSEGSEFRRNYMSQHINIATNPAYRV